jgi:hypothetical protein
MLNNPKPPPCDRGRSNLFGTEPFALIFHLDYNRVFFWRHAQMTFLNPVLDDVDQKLFLD